LAERKQCEFQLIRYVPDPVRNEFVNIGVLLRASEGGQTGLRFTRNWERVQGLHPDADTEMLEAIGSEMSERLQGHQGDRAEQMPGLDESALSNGIQITESRVYMAESFPAGLDELMRLYVDPPGRIVN
jgi:hypothetical protein